MIAGECPLLAGSSRWLQLICKVLHKLGEIDDE